MNILFFGNLGDRIGREIEIDVPDDVRSVSALRRFLGQRFPDARTALECASVRVCVGDAIVADDYRLDGAAGEVQFLPPLSGG